MKRLVINLVADAIIIAGVVMIASPFGQMLSAIWDTIRFEILR